MIPDARRRPNWLFDTSAIIDGRILELSESGALDAPFIVLQPGQAPGAALEDEIRAHVRGRLAPYEYPKEIEFIDALPMTTTGKVQRRMLRLREAERKRAQSGV